MIVNCQRLINSLKHGKTREKPVYSPNGERITDEVLKHNRVKLKYRD